jgi:hypothetical protein
MTSELSNSSWHLYKYKSKIYLSIDKNYLKTLGLKV